jgi:hypothetical protein
MSLPRPPNAGETNNAYPSPRNRKSRLFSAPSSPPNPPPSGPSFPQPAISGHEVPLFSYANGTYTPPHSPDNLPPRPPPHPNGVPAQTAPPSGLPRLGPAAAHMQINRAGASEMTVPQSRLPVSCALGVYVVYLSHVGVSRLDRRILNRPED